MAEQLRDSVSRLEQEHSRLEALFASSADALATVDADGVVRYLNPAGEALLGPALGRSLIEVARNHELSSLLRAALSLSGVSLLLLGLVWDRQEER